MPAIECFLVQATDRVRRSLRRFTLSVSPRSRCLLPSGAHDARVPLDEVVTPASCVPPLMKQPVNITMDDPRWPCSCACGYRFLAKDPRQIVEDRVYERIDIPQRWVFHELPAGAMFDAEWMRDANSPTYPDGMCLAVVLPKGEIWPIDCEGLWTRSGVPPRITVVEPANAVHGRWRLIDGKLVRA